MKGIILAGGSGTRLYPSPWDVSKQLLPVYDKPMIYYPLSVLIWRAFARSDHIHTGGLPVFRRLFADGSHLGGPFRLCGAARPEGLAGFLIGQDFIARIRSALSWATTSLRPACQRFWRVGAVAKGG